VVAAVGVVWPIYLLAAAGARRRATPRRRRHPVTSRRRRHAAPGSHPRPASEECLLSAVIDGPPDRGRRGLRRPARPARRPGPAWRPSGRDS